LLGGGTVPETGWADVKVPATPSKVPAAVWQSRPDLIAAEAEVRQAFALQDSARLNLLPSLSLEAGGAFAGSSLRGNYNQWTAGVGPRLEIPVWDPERIAQVKRSKAEAVQASANYRSTANRAVEEIEGAYVDLSRYRAQLSSFEREAVAKRRAWQDAESKLGSGVDSEIKVTNLARTYRDAAALETRMRLRALDAHLRLVRALGG
jgi:outer membrane protein TolC